MELSEIHIDLNSLIMECATVASLEHSSSAAQHSNFHEESPQDVSASQGRTSVDSYYPYIQPSFINLLPEANTRFSKSMTSKDNITVAKYEMHEEAIPKEDTKEGVIGEPKIVDQDNVADILLLLGSSKAANELKAHNAQHRDAGRMPSNAVAKPPLSISTKESNSMTPRSPQNALQHTHEEYEEQAEFSEVEEDEEYSVEEDELIDDIEDDEWIETLKISSQFTRKISANEVMKRKKAPSGSACEKHKRWKKRCPDDCPLRKAKWRYTSQASYRPFRSSKVPTPTHSLKKDEIEQVIALINSSRTDQWEIAAPKLQTVLRNLEKCVHLSHSISSISCSVAHQRADYVLLIRYVMKNILLDKTQDEKVDFVEEIEKRALCNEMSPPLSDEAIQQLLSRCPSIDSISRRAKRKIDGITTNTGEETDKLDEKKRKKDEKKKINEKILTIACEKHTIMHARCPPQCPDRRPAKDRPPRGRKPKHVKLALLAANAAANAASSSTSSTSSSSSSSHNSLAENSKFQSMKETIASRVALEESRWRNVNRGRYDANCNMDTNTDHSAADSDQSDQSNNVLPSIAEMTKHMCGSDTDEDMTPKMMNRSSSFPFVEGYLDISRGLNSSNENLLKSAARRYLPKACDKHKIMHAKCPASCPERLARDQMLRL